MNQFYALHGDEPTGPTRECNTQPTSYHFKSSTSPTKTSLVVSAIMGRPNHYSIDNGDVEVSPPDFPFEYNYESVPVPGTTTIKSIDYYEMDHII